MLSALLTCTTSTWTVFDVDVNQLHVQNVELHWFCIFSNILLLFIYYWIISLPQVYFFVVFTFIPLLSKIIINKSLVEIFELFTCRLCSLPRILLGEVIIVHITDNILLYRIEPRSNSYGVFVKDGKRCNLYKMPPACTANPKVRFIL